MDAIALLAAAAVMGAIVFSMLAVYQVTASPRGSIERRLGNILSESSSFDIVSPMDAQALRSNRIGKMLFLGSFLKGRSWSEEYALKLDQADIKLTVSEFFSIRIFVALLGGLIPFLVLGDGIAGVLAAAGAAFLGFQLPVLYVSFARGRRISTINVQLVEALNLVSNSLKAGFGLMQALDLASREMKHPIATELRRALHDIHVGSTTEEALLGMSKRSGSDDLDIVVTAMIVQQSTGGNLAEILDNVAHTMRERIRIRGEIKTLTTQQTLTGFIIGGLPIAMLLVFSLISPDYVSPLFHTTIGNLMLGLAAVMEFIGVMIIKKIMAIEV